MIITQGIEELTMNELLCGYVVVKSNLYFTISMCSIHVRI